MKTIVALFISAAMSFAQTAPVAKNPVGTVKQPQPTTTTVTPKESTTTVKLELAESKKQTLQMQRNVIIANAQAQLNGIGKQLEDQDKSVKELSDAVKKENGWGEEYSYDPPQPMQDGTTVPAKWIKTERK